MSIIDNAKEIADLIKKYDNLDLYRKILDLQGEIISLTDEKRDLEEEVKKLKETLSLSKKMTFKKPFYLQEDDPVPFCPLCWEAEKIPIHLTGPVQASSGPSYDCPRCNKYFIG
jgi:hypothetical protein